MLRPFFPELVMSTDLLTLEHPSVLLFCFLTWKTWCSQNAKNIPKFTGVLLHFCHTCSLCRVELVVQFPARGSKYYYAFFLVCFGCDTSYIVSVHIQCQTSIYTLSLCRGHSWRVRLAKQGTLTPPGHLVSPLVCMVHECTPWCSIVGATVTVHQFFCILH